MNWFNYIKVFGGTYAIIYLDSIHTELAGINRTLKTYQHLKKETK